MTVLTDSRVYASDIVKHEYPDRSVTRDVASLSSGGEIVAQGGILTRSATSGEYDGLVAADIGVNAAVGIYLGNKDGGDDQDPGAAAVADCVILTVGPAVLAASKLKISVAGDDPALFSTLSAANQQTIREDLEARGIKIIDEEA